MSQYEINRSLYRAMRTTVDPDYVVPEPSHVNEDAHAMRIRWVQEADKRSAERFATDTKYAPSKVDAYSWDRMSMGRKVNGPTYVHQDADRPEIAYQGMGVRSERRKGINPYEGLADLLPNGNATSGHALAQYEQSYVRCADGNTVHGSQFVGPMKPDKKATERVTWFACNERGCTVVGMERSDITCGHGKATKVAHEIPSSYVGADTVETLAKSGAKNTRPSGRSSTVTVTKADGTVRIVNATDGRKEAKQARGTAVRNRSGRRMVKVDGPAKAPAKAPASGPMVSTTKRATKVRTMRYVAPTAVPAVAPRVRTVVTLATLSPERAALVAEARAMVDGGTIG